MFCLIDKVDEIMLCNNKILKVSGAKVRSFLAKKHLSLNRGSVLYAGSFYVTLILQESKTLLCRLGTYRFHMSLLFPLPAKGNGWFK